MKKRPANLRKRIITAGFLPTNPSGKNTDEKFQISNPKLQISEKRASGSTAKEHFQAGYDQHDGEHAAHYEGGESATAQFCAEQSTHQRGGRPPNNFARKDLHTLQMAQQTSSGIHQDECRRNAGRRSHLGPAKQQQQRTQKNSAADSCQSGQQTDSRSRDHGPREDNGF